MKGTARDFFERESNRYDDFVKERDFVPSLVKKVTPLLRGKVLDVGSGCITDFKDAAFDLYLAFDLSMGMLSGLDRDGKMKAVCGDAIDLPFRDGSFDVIIYRAVLHHLNPEGKGIREMEEIIARVCREAKRVLSGDGKIVVVEPCLPAILEEVEQRLAFVIRLGLRLAGLPYVFLFSIKKLSLLLQNGGWNDLKLAQIGGAGKRWDWITPILGVPSLKIPRWLSPSQVYLIEGGEKDGI
jgi:SAM-dependent methyltransferase